MSWFKKKSLEDQLFDLKFTAKTMARSAKKAEKDEKAEKAKLKKAIQQGNMDGAKIYAENAIRQKNQAMSYLRLSSRIDAVASRLDSAIKMNAVSKNMEGIVKTMGKAMEKMDLEHVSSSMEAFEKQFEDLDMQASYMEGAMASSTSNTTPEAEVAELIMQVADANDLDLKGALDDAGPVGSGVAAVEAEKEKEKETRAPAAAVGAEDDALMARLNNLKTK